MYGLKAMSVDEFVVIKQLDQVTGGSCGCRSFDG